MQSWKRLARSFPRLVIPCSFLKYVKDQMNRNNIVKINYRTWWGFTKTSIKRWILFIPTKLNIPFSSIRNEWFLKVCHHRTIRNRYYLKNPGISRLFFYRLLKMWDLWTLSRKISIAFLYNFKIKYKHVVVFLYMFEEFINTVTCPKVGLHVFRTLGLVWLVNIIFPY